MTRQEMKEAKYQAILDRAIALDNKGKTETFTQVAQFLNRRGFKNNHGKLYGGSPRGVAKVVAQAYLWAEETFGKNEGNVIANAFTGMSGYYAWSDE